MFNGEDHAGWILKTEIYSKVQQTSEIVRVNLAQLCMEGGKLHFSNSLVNGFVNLTWEELKKEFLDKFNGMVESVFVAFD